MAQEPVLEQVPVPEQGLDPQIRLDEDSCVAFLLENFEDFQPENQEKVIKKVGSLLGPELRRFADMQRVEKKTAKYLLQATAETFLMSCPGTVAQLIDSIA